MDLDQGSKRDFVWLKGEQHGFREIVVGRVGPDEPLLHADNAAKSSEHGFRAPMAASTQADFLHLSRRQRFTLRSSMGHDATLASASCGWSVSDS
jgi:hypothetical protein